MNGDLTLRPEGTASVVRSYIENKMFGYPTNQSNFIISDHMFRYERPQAGRFRQFVQFGIEALGSKDPAIDAEVSVTGDEFIQRTWFEKIKACY